jgi:hypothetical protein
MRDRVLSGSLSAVARRAKSGGSRREAGPACHRDPPTTDPYFLGAGAIVTFDATFLPSTTV